MAQKKQKIKLTRKDLFIIKDMSITKYSNQSISENDKYTLITAIIESFLDFVNKKNYHIENGEIWSMKE